ncbi:MAG: class I SAM-dependent rRNA methyltransferase [Polyangiales bacterium]
MATVHLRSGHEEPVWAGHPWVMAQAIERVDGAPGPGDVVTVRDPAGRTLGKGYWSPKSPVPVRVLSRDGQARLDGAWLGERIEHAAGWRRGLLGLPSEQTTGYRLVHGEGDGLAGLVVDVVGDVAIVQLLTIGMKQREEEIFSHVARVTRARSILEVVGPHGPRADGFEVRDRVVRGDDADALRFRERGLELDVPLDVARATGLHFDQRDNRERVERLARGRRMLDAFCYAAPFSLAAARGGAEHVLAIDGSAPVVATAARLARRHGFEDRLEVMRADLKRALPDIGRKHGPFGLVVADPPKLIGSTRQLSEGRAAYRRLNTHLIRLTERDGLLMTCSRSPALSPDELLHTVALAARDAGRECTLLELRHQAGDHPAPPAFVEGRYLKCAVLRVG